jgi:hypothetical protein
MTETNGSNGHLPADAPTDREKLVAALKSWTAAADQPQEGATELLARLQSEDAAAAEKARADALQRQISELGVKLDQVIASTTPQPPRVTRLGLSAAEKSRYIRTYGIDAYNQLPLK